MPKTTKASDKSAKRKEYDKRYDQKRSGRTRNYTVVVYPEDLPEDWRERLDGLSVKWVESPLHDKDYNPDGQPKKAHHHLLFLFSAVKSADQVADMLAELFGRSESGSIIGVAKPQAVSDRSALVRYMAHLDHPSKAQYDVKDIIGHNGADVAELLQYSRSETLDMMIDIEEYIENHHIYELCDLSRAIRRDHPEWYTVVATQCTYYFSAFIRSYRSKLIGNGDLLEYADGGHIVNHFIAPCHPTEEEEKEWQQEQEQRLQQQEQDGELSF